MTAGFRSTSLRIRSGSMSAAPLAIEFHTRPRLAGDAPQPWNVSMTEHEQHMCTADCEIDLAVGICTGCGYTVNACESSKGRGCLACCPECHHPTEVELRAHPTKGNADG